nr:MAG TPA: hypothetical protein [Caudoviricetes sp.]
MLCSGRGRPAQQLIDCAAQRVGQSCRRRQTGHLLAPFVVADHGVGHAAPVAQLLLGHALGLTPPSDVVADILCAQFFVTSLCSCLICGMVVLNLTDC